MKKNLLCLLAFLFSNITLAQNKVSQEVERMKALTLSKNPYTLFTIATSAASFNNQVFSKKNSAVQLTLNQQILKQIEAEKSNFLTLSIPIDNPSGIVLELVPIEIFAPSYKVVNSKNVEINKKSGLYYQGIIKGDKHSIVALCIIDGEISGIISNDKGNFVLGKLQKSSQYIYYKDAELAQKNPFTCQVKDKVLNQSKNARTEAVTSNTACRAVSVYLEADYKMYERIGSSIENTTNFIQALFAQVAVLYSNENISIQISQLKIWDTIDPYTDIYGFSEVIASFREHLGNNFNGDIAHLICGQKSDGASDRLLPCEKPVAYSGVYYAPIENVPVYSWNVYIVAHEIGHSFGSFHTQSCLWPGGAIDNCTSPEGNCLPGPAPVNGGTIMSYCNTNVAGINFNNGFGPLPGNLIRKNYQTCFNSSIPVSEMVSVDVYDTKAILLWKNTFSGSYTVVYKPSNTANWIETSVITNFVQLTDLLPDTPYDWGVKTSCTDFVYATFTTNHTPAVSYCVPGIFGSCFGTDVGIQDVIIDNVNYNPNSGCSTNSNYSLIGNQNITFTKGQTYSLRLNPLYVGGNMVQAGLWIDYNQNGTFEQNEKIFVTSAQTNNPIEGNFTISTDIIRPIAKTRMRIMLTYQNAPDDACGSYYLGEAEDYLVNINIPCQQIVTLLMPDNIYEGTSVIQASASNGKIVASNQISGNTTNVIYQASSIELNPGFKVDNSSVFKAETGGCNY